VGPLRPSVFSLMHEELEAWSGVKLKDVAAYGIRVRLCWGKREQGLVHARGAGELVRGQAEDVAAHGIRVRGLAGVPDVGLSGLSRGARGMVRREAEAHRFGWQRLSPGDD